MLQPCWITGLVAFPLRHPTFNNYIHCVSKLEVPSQDIDFRCIPGVPNLFKKNKSKSACSPLTCCRTWQSFYSLIWAIVSYLGIMSFLDPNGRSLNATLESLKLEWTKEECWKTDPKISLGFVEVICHLGGSVDLGQPTWKIRMPHNSISPNCLKLCVFPIHGLSTYSLYKWACINIVKSKGLETSPIITLLHFMVPISR